MLLWNEVLWYEPPPGAATCGFITPEDPLWQDFLTRCGHDAYHLPGYLRTAAELEGAQPVAFYARRERAEFLVPLLIRELPASLRAPGEWCDAVTPYGYPTPLMHRGSEADLVYFLDLFLQAGRERGLVSAFMRLHPLLPLPWHVLSAYGSCVRHGDTVYIDLCRSDQRLQAETREAHKRHIRRLRREGFGVALDEWDHYRDYMQVYWRTMERVGASDYYFFPESYFDTLRERLGENLHLVTVTAPDGRVAAGSTFFARGGLVQYHLGGCADEFMKLSASKLYVDFMRDWSKEQGCHTFHLGGGLGAGADSLFHFKAGFSATTAPFYTWRLIFDEERYDLLCSSKASTAPASGFFPLYRATA